MTNEAFSPRGFVTGTAVVRDKDGNVKGSFTFGGDATLEQVQAAFPGVPVEVKQAERPEQT